MYLVAKLGSFLDTAAFVKAKINNSGTIALGTYFDLLYSLYQLELQVILRSFVPVSKPL